MTNHNFILGPVDTDSVSLCKPDFSPFTEEEQQQLIDEINSQLPELINYAHDGYYKTCVVLKAKNYILVDQKDKVKLKGSSIKDQKKEPALREMLNRFIEALIEGRETDLVNIYHDYIKEAYAVEDISRWCAKKTITKPVLECATNEDARLNERKVYDAVKNIPGLQEGDKVYLYPCIISQSTESKQYKNGNVKTKVIKEVGLKLSDQWDGDHDREKLVERVVATTNIFNNLLGDDTFIDYSKSKNKHLLEKLLDPTPNEWC